jgi:hypothetical protein
LGSALLGLADLGGAVPALQPREEARHGERERSARACAVVDATGSGLCMRCLRWGCVDVGCKCFSTVALAAREIGARAIMGLV